MVITKPWEEDASLDISFSDNNKKLIQIETGNVYDVAIDIPAKYHYTESEEDVDDGKVMRTLRF